MDNYNEDFSGVFMFTNPTDKERKYLWNNKEYTFPPKSTVPLIIPTETLENIQEIRKRFAYRMAQERLYEGEKVKNSEGVVTFDYKKAKDQGNGMPPTFDEKILEPFIQECLTPLPISRAKVAKAKDVDDDKNYKITKAVGRNEDLNQVFKEDTANAPSYGEMSDR